MQHDFFQALLSAPSVLLTGPRSPDGDSLGASLALARVLERRGVTVGVSGEAGWRYRFLPGAASLIADHDVEPSWHTVVILDGDKHRLGRGVQAAYDAAATTGIIDHHGSTVPGEYDHAWVEGHATSTCQMLYRWFGHLGIDIDRDLATLLHVGSVFDTGCFRYDNTRPDTLAMASDLVGRGIDHANICTQVLQARRWQGLQAFAQVVSTATRHLEGRLVLAHVPMATQQDLGLQRDDLEGVVEALADVVACDVGALLVHQPDGAVKVSLRSRETVDVCRIAQGLTRTGGGHRKAAGAYVNEAPPTVEARLIALVEGALEATAATSS